MVDIDEKGEQRLVQTEKQSLQTAPDAQAARNADVSGVKAFQSLNKDAHNGSAGGSDQLESIQIVRTNHAGHQEVVAARQKDPIERVSMEELILKGRRGDEFAVNIVQQMRAVADLPEEQRSKVLAKLQDTADKMYGRSAPGERLGDQSKPVENIDTQTIVAPVLKEHIEKNVYQKQQSNEWQAFNRLTPKQQRAVIEAFETGSNIGQKAYEQKIEAIAESVPRAYYHVAKELYDSAIGAGTFLFEAAQKPEKVPEALQRLTESISGALVGGAKISQILAKYGQETAQSGDYNRPLRDLQTVATLANERWEAMPLEKRTEKASELVADMGIGSIAGAAERLAKSGKLIDALEDLAKYTRDLTEPGQERARQALGTFLDKIYQPKGLTINGIEMPIPRPVDDHVMFMKGENGLKNGVSESKKTTTEHLDLGELDSTLERVAPVGKGGDWLVLSERPSYDVVRQTSAKSCVAAVGEMLSEGLLKQEHLISEVGTVPERLAKLLGNSWKGGFIPIEEREVLGTKC